MRKDVIFAVFLVFCLASVLFMVSPTKSVPATVGQYDPWIDVNDDGVINMYDLGYLARSFMATGTPINKTALLLELQSRLDDLNYSLLNSQNIFNTRMTTQDALIAELESRITELENRVSILETLHGLPIDWFNGLVGYWKLDEGAGTVVGDSSGNNNNGTLVNNPQWVDGVYGKALSFNGSNSVMIPDSQSLRLQAFSLEAWIYMTERPFQHGGSAIINKIQGPTGDWGYKLQFEPAPTNDNLLISIGDGGAQRFLLQYNSINDLTLGVWHHVVGTYDGNSTRLYIDGMLKMNTTSGPFTIVNDDRPLMLGAEYSPEGNLVMFNGLIDNIMIYNRALSAEEVMAEYLLPPP